MAVERRGRRAAIDPGYDHGTMQWTAEELLRLRDNPYVIDWATVERFRTDIEAQLRAEQARAFYQGAPGPTPSSGDVIDLILFEGVWMIPEDAREIIAGRGLR